MAYRKRFKKRRKFRFSWRIALQKHKNASNYHLKHRKKGFLRKIYYHDDCSEYYYTHKKPMPRSIKRALWNKHKNA